MMKPLLSEIWGEAATDNPATTLERFHEAIAQYPDNIALVCTHQEAGLYDVPNASRSLNQSGNASRQYLRWTFKDLKAAIDRLVESLQSIGVCEGTAIVTLLPDGAEFCLVWWAAMELGAVMAPLDYRRLSNQEETTHMLSAIAKGTNAQGFLFVAQNQEHLDATAISAAPALAKVIVTPESNGSRNGIVEFGDLMKPKLQNGTKNASHREVSTTVRRFQNDTTDCSIVFTSGSTSLPKGVRRCYPLQPLIACDVFGQAEYDTLPGDLWCASAPNNHSVGTATLIAPTSVGAGTLYAGPRFSPESTIEALTSEPCTHMLLVPAMVNLLSDSIVERGKHGQTQLRAVMVAGSPPTKSILEKCLQDLGASGVCIRYGSTEGIACSSSVSSDVESLINPEGYFSVGGPVRGTGVKICDPDGVDPQHPPLPRGVPGEIHFSGPFSSRGLYVGQTDADDVCYRDRHGKRWLISGDQGIVSQNGQLYVVGRYKDMIIRGGEIIAPLAIETCLAESKKLAHEIIQIVGRPDDLSGETRVAIVSGHTDARTMAKDIHEVISRSMGSMWIPEEVIPLHDLGLGDWPRTALGKISKRKLRELVRQRQVDGNKQTNGLSHSSNRTQHDSSKWRLHVLNLWAKAIGLEAEDVPVDAPVAQIADSLMLARVRGQIRREVPGQEKLSMQDLVEATTISKQIDLIISRIDSEHAPTWSHTEADNEKPPPSAADMIHLAGQPNMMHPTKLLVSKAIADLDFTWDDVVDVFPAQNFVSELSQSGTMDSAKFQTAYVTKTSADIEMVKQAMKVMLNNNRILASYLVWDQDHEPSLDPGLALHVTLKHTDKLFQHVLQDGGTVETVGQLTQLAADHPHPEWALLPGLLFRVLLYRIRETGTVGFIISSSHAIMDATYHARFQSDLDVALADLSAQSLRPHASYRLWSESYYSFQNSPRARASVAWHAGYLHDVGEHITKSQWPPIPKRQPFDATGKDYGPGARHQFTEPNLAELRKEHTHISTAIVVKAALALFNMRRTGHSHAMFSNVQAGRTAWPFLPSAFFTHGAWNHFDEATDVAGPLLQSVTNLISTKDDKTVLEFLYQLQEHQNHLTEHAHTPWPAIEDALDSAVKAAGKQHHHRGLMRKVFTTQIFNWIPGMGAQVAAIREPYTNFKILRSVTRWQVGVIVRAGVGGPDNDTIFLHLLGDALTAEQMTDMTVELEASVRAIVNPANWHAAVDAL